ncbi:hypothetical protein LTR09_002600 [Extremus antarcticus]|uniref:PH domain-containing protein n=1 Tax=Extremus antarcticus TaxID=702011 RepID=A0AAJ0GFZ7_9PEZI|nr:hypothetical protein LTR09_002600 [Extremus antarcticus]
MSLFNLFSRPKVEKQRGYGERGFEAPPPLPAKDLRKTASTPNLLHVQQEQANESSTHLPPPSPAATAPLKSKSRLKFAETTKPNKRTGPFTPPPLFQAYPQSMKDGCIEVSTMSVEAATHKSKGWKADAAAESSSIDTKRSRSALKHVANGGSGHELPQKIFVLVTSGYLLQYAESGPSNRLPEKILHLSKDSAAFASDLLPGKHYVLQVSQAVNQEGGLVANSGNIFFKLGLRSAAARRMTSSFLLVMPSAKEMESWMTAIRREIVALGGKQLDADPVRPTTRDPASALREIKKTPSHRYQVKRNPSKVERLTSPSQDAASSPSALAEDNTSDSDTATIDNIEIEASKLGEDAKDATTRERALSDVPSMSSSTAPSVEQSQLNNIRSSESNSVRTSHTSHAGTLSSPAANSQPSSVAGSPPTERPLKEAIAETGERTSPQKPNPRSLASYSMNWRRSGVPLALQKSGTLPPVLNMSPGTPKFAVIEESPVTGRNSPGSTNPSPKKSLTAVRSEPNLHSVSRIDSKRESKASSPPPVPSVPSAVTTSPPRPESTTESLPSGSIRSSDIAQNRRISLQPLATQSTATKQAPVRTLDANRGKRISFSMPLKVNPSGIHSQPSSAGTSRRSSQLHEPDAAGDTPAVHILAAKVDAPPRTSNSQRLSVSPSTAPLGTPTPRSRYSLIPPPITITAITSPVMPTRPPPSPINGHLTSALTRAQSDVAPLRRPTSLQVRSDMAPFLSSVRNSQTGQIDARAIPIRGMKPSRSANNVAALATHHENAEGFRSTTPKVPEEADQAMPLPERAMSPLPPRAGSRTSIRKGLKTRSSLPELDFGIPVVGLGPPAPPPSAPLPPPPPGSRPTSPPPSGPLPSLPPGSRPTSPMQLPAANGIDAVAGLGIRVS